MTKSLLYHLFNHAPWLYLPVAVLVVGPFFSLQPLPNLGMYYWLVELLLAVFFFTSKVFQEMSCLALTSKRPDKNACMVVSILSQNFSINLVLPVGIT